MIFKKSYSFIILPHHGEQGKGKLLIIFAILLAHMACFADMKNNQTPHRKMELVKRDPVFKEWSNHYKKYDSTLTWQDARFDPETKYQIQKQVDCRAVEKDIRQPLLCYSPNMKLFLDAFIGTDIENENGRIVMAKDVDNGVKLCDKVNKTTALLQYSGPGERVEAVSWIDNSNCILMGVNYNYPNTPDNTKLEYGFFVIWCDLVRKTRSLANGPTMGWEKVANMGNKRFSNYESREMKRLRKTYKHIEE